MSGRRKAIRTSAKRANRMLDAMRSRLESAAYELGKQEAERHWKLKNCELIQPTQRGDVWLQPPPDKHYCEVDILGGLGSLDYALARDAYQYVRVQRVMFRARDMFWRHQSGVIVRWVEWEPMI